MSPRGLLGRAVAGTGLCGRGQASPALSPGSLSLQITAQQIAAQGQPQKVTYATQPALKTQFLTTPISQAQKLAGTQQVQTQIQVSTASAGWTTDAAAAPCAHAHPQRPPVPLTVLAASAVGDAQVVLQ